MRRRMAQLWLTWRALRTRTRTLKQTESRSMTRRRQPRTTPGLQPRPLRHRRSGPARRRRRERTGKGRVIFRGRHLAADALRAITSFAWTIPELHRTELYIEPWNTPSIRTAEQGGYLCEGLLRSRQEIAGQRRDMLLHSTLRDRADRLPGTSRPHLSTDILQVSTVLPRNDQHMPRRDRARIHAGDDGIVLVDHVRPRLTAHDVTENAGIRTDFPTTRT